MKKIYIFLFTIASVVYGGTFTNESPAGMKVIWDVPTNTWPIDRIWSYKVIPQDFSDVVISNAMAIGSFTMKDKRKLPGEALAMDKKAISFSTKDEKRWLSIAPTLGYIEYHDQNAEAGYATTTVHGVNETVPVPAVGVPNQQETTRLGLMYLRLLGVDISQIARKPASCELDLHWQRGTRTWTDQKTQNEIVETNNSGVFFTRQIDGIEMSGFGDIYIEFGNNAKIKELKASWRNLQPYQLLDNFITPEQIVKSISAGHVPLPQLVGWPLNEIKTLTITNATPRYGRGRKSGDEPLDFVMPALQLDAIIGNGITNRVVWFQTGIMPP